VVSGSPTESACLGWGLKVRRLSVFAAGFAGYFCDLCARWPFCFSCPVILHSSNVVILPTSLEWISSKHVMQLLFYT
jgi:hypothetical protein